MNKPGYMHGLDFMRVLLSVVVIYNHYAGWMQVGNEPWGASEAVDGVLIGPLHLNPNLGFVGVSVFMLISGLVVTQVSFRETTGQFLGARAARLLPSLWIATLLAWAFASWQWVNINRIPDFDDLFWNLLLVQYAVPETAQVLAVVWTLIVQVVFYLFVAATIPLLRRWPWLPPALSVALVSVLLSITPPDNAAPSTAVRMIATFLPVLFIGQLISLVRLGKLPAGAGVAFGTLHFLLFVQADLTSKVWPNGQAFPRTLLIVVLIMLLAIRADGKLVRSPVVAAIAKRTYAVYLVHIPISFALFHVITPAVGSWLAVAFALLCVAVASELLYRFVEDPVARWYRRRTKARTAKPELVGNWGT
ncbi:acyltransferase family protein [Lentzea sp. NPDC092896]|uniref:acyltransferase family protein n=1 Tax=Lentzea sp. NPDC092896 TaxID=3364127 RepID=UPI003813B822